MYNLGLRLPDGADVKTKSPALPAGSELPGKRSRKVSSSSDEETTGKIVRTPRKLRRKTNSRSSVSESPQLKELLTNPDYHFADRSPQKPIERKRTISIAEISTNIEFEESLQDTKPVTRSPPKRRRIVKRSSLSETGKNSKSCSVTPSKLSRSVSQPQTLPRDELGDLDVDMDEDVKKQQETTGVQCETNDEGFSADEECESDDTIDMNKLAQPEMEVNNDEQTNPEHDISKLITNTLDPGNICDVSPIAPKQEIVTDSSNPSKLEVRSEVDKCDDGFDEPVKEINVEVSDPSKVNVSLDSTDDMVPFSSPAVDNVTSTLKKKEKSDVKLEGTPAGSGIGRKTAKRNGKNGQYKHGFFISDAENSEVEETTQSDSARFNKDDEELQAYLCSIYNVENELEDLMDVKALDDIVDIDQRILVAERQMNLIQKRYKQLYREMEKLDNLKRRIRKKKKNKSSLSQNFPKTTQRGCEETGSLDLDGLSKTDTVIDNDCKNDNFQLVEQPSIDQRRFSTNENALLSNETECDLEAHDLSSKEVHAHRTEVESGVSEEQLNAIQSLISLHNQC